MDFKPPGHFSMTDNWSLWRQKFDIYLTATDKKKASDETKIATLLACMGDEGIYLYNTFEPDKKSSLDELLKEFDTHFLPKRVTAMESFKFHNMVQDLDQNIDQYLTELKKQAQLCQFICENPNCKQSFENRMIRDRLIIGIKDKESQLRLLREKDLTVNKVIEYCKSIELSKENMKYLKPDEEVNMLRSSRKIKCKKCTYEHFPNRCPAFNKTCANCQQKGHFAKACSSMNANPSVQTHKHNVQENSWKNKESRNSTNVRSVNLSEIDESSSAEEVFFVSECIYNNKSCWNENILVEGKLINFKLDSGSDISILPKKVFNTLTVKPIIQNSFATLISYGNFKFKPFGEVFLNCVFNNSKIKIKFIIVDFIAEPLLGLNDCLRFNLIKRIFSVSLLPKTKEEVYEAFKDSFEGLGNIPGMCKIELSKNAKPVVQCQRKVPLSLHEPLKNTLDSLESKNVVQKVDYPTEWVNSLMIVEKPDKTLRLCIDPKPLNKYIRRSYFMIPTINDIIGKLAGKSVFSVIDMKDGFWQLVLDKESSNLCVFNTPFGRYKFNRLPFGISSAPELFQRRNFELFGDIKGLHIYFDDLILASENEMEHDKALQEIFIRAKQYNVKFNYKKFQYKLTEVKFMGLIISADGIRPDDENVAAINAIEAPTTKSEVLRILGLAKFFSKFVPNLSSMTSNLRNLTHNNVRFNWTEKHDKELNSLKQLISNSPILKIFNPDLDITVQCDASSEGLGCVLLQNNSPVSFASRTMTKSEKRYAQIEKELLAICFAMEKFHYFVYGHRVTVQSDHKPLIPIFSKDLDKVSNRLQRMLMRLLKYDINIVYLPGRDMLIADLLSRAYIKDHVEEDSEMQYVIHAISNNIPMSDEKKDLFRKSICDDQVLSQVYNFCKSGWPKSRKKLNSDMKFYYNLREKIYLSNELLFLENKIIVPSNLRQEMIQLVHKPHFGIQKTKMRARQLFYWPKIDKDLEYFISKCEACQLNQRMNQKESLVNYPIPTYPFQYVHSDFFQFNDRNFLLFVDAYSNWIEVAETKSKTSDDVIKFAKEKFCQFGIPEIFYADNVPFNSNNFKTFAKEWNFKLIFSSPHHHQSNGLAERAVGIVKNMLIKSNSTKNLQELLLEYRNNPLTALGLSPSEMMFGRLLKTKIPISSQTLVPRNIDRAIVQQKLKEKQDNQKKFYDQNAKDLVPLAIGDNVIFQKNNKWEKGKVKSVCNERSYIVTDLLGNDFHRNRKFIKKTNLVFNFDVSHNSKRIYDFSNEFTDETADHIEMNENNNVLNSTTPIVQREKRNVKPPVYLKDYISIFEDS